MIPIQLWRARIGLFNAKCHSGPRSSPLNSEALLEKSSIPSTAHSPKCDSLPEHSTIKHVPSSNLKHKRAFSAENSSSAVVVDKCIEHEQQSAERKNCSARKPGSEAAYFLLFSLNTDMLYLSSDLLRDAVVMLLIAIVSQLLILSGDIETNPGPIATDKPTMDQLKSLKLSDGSEEYLCIIKWIASLPRSECVNFAHSLLDDSVKVKNYRKKSDTDEFVEAVLCDWLSSSDGSKAVPHTWIALADCIEDAGLPGDLVKAIRETFSSSSPDIVSGTPSSGSSPAAEPEALKHLFSYLVNSIDTATLLPAALSKGLITERQRSECYHETDPYKKAETFLGHLQRAVNADYENYYTFVQILKETGQRKIGSHLRDELTHSIRSMQPPSASSSTDEGEQVELVPDSLVEELARLRCAFAKLIRNYEKKLLNSPEAQQELVAFLQRLFDRAVEDHSFQSHFNAFVEEEVSLFNILYLKELCDIYPEDVRATTRQLVEEYEQLQENFVTSATVSQFKQLFLATATPSKLVTGKAPIKCKLKNRWGSKTLQDVKQLVALFGVSGKCLHLSKVEDGCIAVTWLCSTSEVKQLKMAIIDNAESLQTKGVLQVFVGEELVLECTQSDPSVTGAYARKEQLWLEEKCDKLELELKEKSNEMKILQEKLAAVLKSDEALPVQSEAHHYRAGGSSSAESEALKHLFSYLVNSIDTAALIPAGLRRDLITNHQKLEYYNETDPYKKAEMFLSHLQQAVNADYDNYHTFVQILKQTSQLQIAFRLRDELAHSFRSMQQLSASSSTDEGEQVKLVPDSLVEELAGLRSAFARLLRNYEEQLQSSSEAQNEFVKFLPRLFHRAVDNHSFQSHFNTLIEEEVSLFNIFYLKQLCGIFPEDVRATTRQLVDEYEQQCQHFMTCATVSQFKQLFPATATSSKLSKGKVNVELKVKSYWDESTLDDLTKLVALFDVSGNHLHLSKVENGCSAVTWLCSIIEVKQLNMAIVDKTDSLQSMGVLQVFVGKELVLESPMSHFSATAPVEISPLEGPSDKSSGVQTNEFMTTSLPSATKSYKPITAVHLVPQVTDIEYQCPICLEVFTDEVTPYLTDCGHHLCGMCCDRMRKTSKKECPTCRKPDMLKNARCDNYFQRLVKNLKVRCSDYEEGCEWEGELKDLNDHLERQCGIACPFGCGKYARSSDMKEHTRHCHNRMISCENCGYYNTFTIVTEQHYPICPQSTSPAITSATASPQYLYNHEPIEFTIGDFSEKKRIDEKWLSSNFYAHNGDYKFNLNVYPNGIGDGIRSHLSVHTKLMSGKQPFEGDIQIELLNWKEDKNHHSATICFNRHNHTVYRVTSKETETRSGQPDQFISHTDMAPTTDTKYLLGDFFKLRVSVAVYSTPIPPMIPSWMTGPREATPLSSHDDSQPIIAQFTISEFSMRKKFNNMYFSEPFTTSPQGYKFSIKAMANGCRSGKGSNITMSAIIMKGQHDDHLKWPFTGTIIIEVLNWLEDKGHHKQVFSIDPNDGLVRVTKGEYGRDFGFFKFISHASLLLDSFANTQYLYEDCICVRVRKSRTAGD